MQLEAREKLPSGDNLEGVRDPSTSMMHRTVRSDGKHAISRFKFLSYDSTTNQSLILCSPITGRGHQLRVHLQLIGHPIHNDVEYGGTLDNMNIQWQEEDPIQYILDLAASMSECHHEESITTDEVKSAIQLCKCCRDGKEGVKVSFNSEHLFKAGHSIELHAL